MDLILTDFADPINLPQYPKPHPQTLRAFEINWILRPFAVPTIDEWTYISRCQQVD